MALIADKAIQKRALTFTAFCNILKAPPPRFTHSIDLGFSSFSCIKCAVQFEIYQTIQKKQSIIFGNVLNTKFALSTSVVF